MKSGKREGVRWRISLRYSGFMVKWQNALYYACTATVMTRKNNYLWRHLLPNGKLVMELAGVKV